jgi:hypothetical protein
VSLPAKSASRAFFPVTVKQPIAIMRGGGGGNRPPLCLAPCYRARATPEAIL